MMGMRRIGSKLSGVLLAAVLLAGAHDAAFADGTAGPAVAPAEAARPDPADAIYDDTQPGADDPRVKEGFAAYQAGDFKKAYDIWLPLAEAGNAEAQFRVGRLYSFGEGLNQNYDEAVKYYLQASNAGHVVAAYNLGVVYHRGRQGEYDEISARAFFRTAACSGHANAQRNLGLMMLVGLGGKVEVEKGLTWLLISDLGGVNASDALEKLSDRYTHKDLTAAKRKFEEWRKSHSSHDKLIIPPC